MSARCAESTSTDWELVAEETEGMAEKGLHEVRNHQEELRMHLIKWRWQPGEHVNPDWQSAVLDPWQELARILEGSLSLISYMKEPVARVWVWAKVIDVKHLPNAGIPS
ncbi:DUF29 family protein [Acidithiobacillus sulfuriphilus]|uniref:DUF29 family protein n=1 Tax=Acidithiobacillus sulfuriphilus TaxID=1867749 RepID=UPI003F5F5D41